MAEGRAPETGTPSRPAQARRLRRALAASGIAATGALLLAACSSTSTSSVTTSSTTGTSSTVSPATGPSVSASDTAQQILETASKAIGDATSVTFQGVLTKSGSTLKIDATAFANGDFNGTLDQQGETAQVIGIGATDYIKANSSFWRSNGAPAGTAGQLNGIWISEPNSSGGLTDEFSLHAIAGEFSGQFGAVTKRTTSTINGVQAVSIYSASHGTLWIATSGPAYPLEIIPAPGKGTGQLTFSGWNAGTVPAVPAGAKPATSFG